MVRTRLLAAMGFVLVTACSTSGATAVSSPTASAKALLVFTTWVPDSKVNNGPEPGYKPALSGLSGHDIKSAAVTSDASGSVWLIQIAFTPQGTAMFAKLTGDNVAACPGDPLTAAGAACPQRHLAIWLDLTQADIDHWEDPRYVAMVAAPYDLSCVSRGLDAEMCAKFLSDPITLEPIAGGSAQITGPDTQQSAKELAAAINSER